jgi:hypothetical protein
VRPGDFLEPSALGVTIAGRARAGLACTALGRVRRYATEGNPASAIATSSSEYSWSTSFPAK